MVTWIVIIAVILLVGLFLFNNSSEESGDLSSTSAGSKAGQELEINDVESGDAMDKDVVDIGTSDQLDSKTIQMSGTGFSPSSLSVKKGDKVKFMNVGSKDIWPATAIHPTHEVYPGSDISKCFSGEDTSSIFDSCGGVAPGSSYSFTFNEVGEWGYHDHMSAGVRGKIIVE
jgi:plastocyanin